MTCALTPARPLAWSIRALSASLLASTSILTAPVTISAPLTAATLVASAWLGATPAATFRSVTLPLIAPAMAAGFLLAFTLSLDDFVLASFTSGPGSTTLPMRIYSQVRLGVTPEVNAVCTILIALVTIGVIIASIFSRRREAERQRAERLAAAAP